MSATLNAQAFADFFTDTSLARTIIQIHECKPPGDILVFVPGLHEISKTIDALSRAQMRAQHRPELYALHSTTPRAQQQEAPPPVIQLSRDAQQQEALTGQLDNGRRKVIVSTNIAETSLTVENVKYVVDSGNVRVPRYEPRTGTRSLDVEPVSLASAMQGAGRAGRTAPGTCFRVYSRALTGTLAPLTTPVIQRAEFTGTLLRILSAGWNPVSFPFLDPPSVELVQDAMNTLSWMGAMEDGELTYLGKEMARIQTTPQGARALIEAKASGCSDQVAALVALSPKKDDLWLSATTDRDKERKARRMKEYVNRAPTGEHLIVLLILQDFYKQGGAQQARKRAVVTWCQDHMLSYDTLCDVANTHNQLRDDLKMASAARNLETVILDDDMSACVRRALAFGFFLNVARIQLNEDNPIKCRLNPKDVWHITFRERVAIQVKEPQKLVRSKWILFDHLTISGSSKRRGLTSPVEQSWLEEAAPALDFQTRPAAHAGWL